MGGATISKQAAQTIAAAIRPQIRAYIDANRAKYEAFLKDERKRRGAA